MTRVKLGRLKQKQVLYRKYKKHILSQNEMK